MKSLFRRSAAVVLAMAFALVLLTGCGDDSSSRDNSRDRHTTNEENRGGSNVDDNSSEELGGDEDTENYPVIEAVDYSDMELETISNSQMGYSFPAGEWVQIWDNPLQIAWIDTINSDGQAVNISVNLVSTLKLPKNWLEDALEELQEEFPDTYGDSITIESIDVRTLNGEKVIYTEVVTKINDEMIDLMIEEGVYTEADIDALGGRERILSAPPTTQIAIYAEKDGYVYVCTGTYYEEDQKQIVLDTMTIMIGTMEKK